jgi:hypothetical protein
MKTTYLKTTALSLSLLAALPILGCTIGCTMSAAEEDESSPVEEGTMVAEASQALIVCGDGIQANGELCFLAPTLVTSMAAGGDAIAAGFMNAGSNLDLVTTSSPGDLLRIKLGDGSSGFPSTFSYTAGDGPTDVAVGDFNNDGLEDVIMTNFHTDDVRVRWGGGSPSWGSFNTFAVGDGPIRVQAGDLNGDGRDDMVTRDGLSDTLTVRLGVAGGFAAAQTLTTGAFGAGPSLADCDNDGDLDLIYAEGLNAAVGLRVRKNNGAGSFGAALSTSIGTGQDASSLTVGDWNEDGIADVVVSMSDHAMVRLLGAGSCAFGSKVSAATDPNPFEIKNADMDQDGHLDLVIAHFSSQTISIYLGHGNGNFSPPTVLSPGNWVVDLALGDFNSDGTPDIAFAGTGGAHLLTSNP